MNIKRFSIALIGVSGLFFSSTGLATFEYMNDCVTEHFCAMLHKKNCDLKCRHRVHPYTVDQLKFCMGYSYFKKKAKYTHPPIDKKWSQKYHINQLNHLIEQAKNLKGNCITKRQKNRLIQSLKNDLKQTKKLKLSR